MRQSRVPFVCGAPGADGKDFAGEAIKDMLAAAAPDVMKEQGDKLFEFILQDGQVASPPKLIAPLAALVARA